MPVNAPCAHTINVDWRNRYKIEKCAEKGPCTELYLPFETRKVLFQMERETVLPRNAIDLIAQYAAPATKQLYLKDAYHSYVGVQLDARAYTRKEQVRTMPFERFFNHCYQTDNEDFCNDIYQQAFDTLNYPVSVIVSEIQLWIDAEMATDNRTFTSVGLDDLAYARDELIREQQEDNNENGAIPLVRVLPQQQNPDEGEEEENEEENEEDDDDDEAW